MLQWLMRLLCRPVIVHGLDRDTTENTENGLDTIRMITTDSPRLTVTPGECYASDVITQIRRDLRHTHDNSDAVNCNAGELNDLIFRRLNLPPENDSAGCDGTYGSPKLDSAAADSGAVRLDDLTFRRLSFPPEEFATGWDAAAVARRNGDYIWRDRWTRPSVCARLVTGSLRCGHHHGLLSFHCLERVLTPDCHCRTTVVRITPDICYSCYTWHIEGYAFCSSIIVVLIIWYCSGVCRIRAMASDGLPDREQAGPSCAPSGPLPGTFLGPALDIRSESLYELGPEIPDVMGLRALRPDAASVKVMSVRDSWCIRVVTLDNNMACGYHEILLYDMGEEELPFVSLSELDYLRHIWPRAVFAFMT